MDLAITPEDLTIFNPDITEAQAEALITGAIARAQHLAPCLKGDLDPDLAAAAKDIIVEAILRRVGRLSARSGQVTTRTSGPFTERVETREGSREIYLPSEIGELQGLCRTASSGNTPRFYFPEPEPWP